MRVTLNEESQSAWQSQNLEHLRYEYDLKPDDIVIDIGAYRGEWATQIYCKYGCRLIVIEPTPWIVGFPFGEVINKAASDHDGKQSFGGAYYYTSSYEHPNNTEYECFDINTLLSEYNEIALVKINTEGNEFEILPHIIANGLHRRIKNLQIQFHEIEGEPYQEWYNSIAESLTESHELTFSYSFCWENWHRK